MRRHRRFVGPDRADGNSSQVRPEGVAGASMRGVCSASRGVRDRTTVCADVRVGPISAYGVFEAAVGWCSEQWCGHGCRVVIGLVNLHRSLGFVGERGGGIDGVGGAEKKAGKRSAMYELEEATLRETLVVV